MSECAHHNGINQCAHHDISRRRFTSLAIAGAGSLLLPASALADTTDALSIMCIDFRLVNRGISFLNRKPPAAGTGKYDIVALAGASLAGVSTALKETVPGFWQQVSTAVGLHKIQKVVMLDHMQCGAYNAEFNNGERMPRHVELPHHLDTWVKVADEFHKRAREGKLPALPLDFFLMELNGRISERRHIP